MYGLLFAFSLKGLCKLSLQGLPVPYEIGIAVYIVLSAFISIIIVIVNQYIRGEGDNINFNKSAYIFTVSMAFNTFFIF